MSISMLKALHRRAIGITHENEVIAPHGVVAGGGRGRPALRYTSPDSVAFVEDFIGSADDTGKPLFGGHLRQVVGDTGHTSAVVAGTNGVWRMFSATTAAVTADAASGVGLTAGSLQWKGNQGADGANSGRLRFGARLKLESVSRTIKRVHVFAGFSDVASYEFPAYDTGAGFINNASDFMGFYFGAGADTGWSAVAKKSTAGDSGIQVVALDTGVAANTYDWVELEYRRGQSDTGGRVTFYVNGRVAGSIDSPIVPTNALTPCIYAFQQDTGGDFVDVDLVAVSAPRDTGL